MTQKQHKVDIFAVLSDLSAKDSDFFDKLTDEEQKALHPLVLMRWMSGTTNPIQIIFLNELVNQHVFTLSNHKELLIKLLAMCGSGNRQRYKWLGKKKSSGSLTMAISVIREYYRYNTKSATEIFPILTKDQILGYAAELGRQPDDIRKLKRELKDKT